MLTEQSCITEMWLDNKSANFQFGLYLWRMFDIDHLDQALYFSVLCWDLKFLLVVSSFTIVIMWSAFFFFYLIDSLA